MSIERSIQQRCIPLTISLIDPIPKLFLNTIFPMNFPTLPPHLQLHFPDINLDKLNMPLKSKLMQHIIPLRINQRHNINTRISLKIFLQLLNISIDK